MFFYLKEVLNLNRLYAANPNAVGHAGVRRRYAAAAALTDKDAHLDESANTLFE
jgi:hypothetical protein